MNLGQLRFWHHSHGLESLKNCNPAHTHKATARNIATIFNVCFIFSSLSLKIIEGKKINPVNIPITKPPMCEKLSIKGSKPKPNDIMIDDNNIIKSFHGWITNFQFWTKSSNTHAMIPIIILFFKKK